jgi:hypothetical protein
MFALLFEIGLLAALAYWGWHLGREGTVGAAVAAASPVAAAVIWILFAAPGLSGRRAQAIVETPGWMRLAIEFGLIALAAYGVWSAGSRPAGETLLTAAALLLAVSWEPALWLARYRPERR